MCKDARLRHGQADFAAQGVVIGSTALYCRGRARERLDSRHRLLKGGAVTLSFESCRRKASHAT